MARSILESGADSFLLASIQPYANFSVISMIGTCGMFPTQVPSQYETIVQLRCKKVKFFILSYASYPLIGFYQKRSIKLRQDKSRNRWDSGVKCHISVGFFFASQPRKRPPSNREMIRKKISANRMKTNDGIRMRVYFLPQALPLRMAAPMRAR